MTANIYVVMHKKTEIPVIDGYKSLFVGSCGMEAVLTVLMMTV